MSYDDTQWLNSVADIANASIAESVDEANSLLQGESAAHVDGPTLATVGRTVLLWNLSNLLHLRDDVVARACAVAERGFDREEWNR